MTVIALISTVLFFILQPPTLIGRETFVPPENKKVRVAIAESIETMSPEYHLQLREKRSSLEN